MGYLPRGAKQVAIPIGQPVADCGERLQAKGECVVESGIRAVLSKPAFSLRSVQQHEHAMMGGSVTQSAKIIRT